MVNGGERASGPSPRRSPATPTPPRTTRRRPGGQPSRQGTLKCAALAGLGMLTLVGLGPLGSGGCQSYDDVTFDPRAVTRDELARSQLTTRPTLRPLPTTRQETPTVPGRSSTTLPANIPATGPSVSELEAVRLPLREILQRSVVNSAEVRVAGFDPAINAMRVIEAEARFDPRFFSNFQFQRQDQQNAGQVIQDPLNPFSTLVLDAERSDVYTVEAGIRQLLPGGGEARISYQVQQSDFDPQRFRINPFWENRVQVEFTQPLLRDFGTEINAARIRIARNDQRISVLDFRRVLEENLTELERDYWQLYQAEREVRIQEELLQQTIQTYSTLLERFLKGLDASAIPVRQAESAVHQRKSALVQAKQQIRDLSADIKRRMNDPEFPVAGPSVILTSTDPLTQPVNFRTEEQIDSAMQNRLELAQQMLRIDSSSIAQQVARNAKLPQLNLVGNAGFNGVDQNLSGSFNEFQEFNHFSASIGLQFEFPIGNREAKAVYRRAILQRLQAVEQYRNLVGQVALDVVLSLNLIDSSYEQIITRQQSRLATAEQLRLIQQREDVGNERLTPEFVNVKLQAQEQLAIAYREEAAAIAAYNTAIQRLERSKGTLLRYNNIQLEEDRALTQLPQR